MDFHMTQNTVSRYRLWKIMAILGCPTRLIATMCHFHGDMLARVQNYGMYSEPFSVTNEFKQDCVLTPTLFSMMLCLQMLIMTVMMASQ